MHREQLDRLNARMMQERLTLVPIQMYFKEGRAKVELGLAKGRQKGDKRQAMAERDAKMEAARAMGRQRKGSDW
jgi:SsrA-binding protein